MKTSMFTATALISFLALCACGERVENALVDDDSPPAQTQTAPQPEPAPVKTNEAQRPAPAPIPVPAEPVPIEADPVPTTIPAALKPIVETTPFPVRRCMNIGNALEAPNEGEWGYSIRARDFNTIKQTGFDTVRIPIRWDTHTMHRSPYTINPAFMARVREVVAQAQSAGLGVIIDVHHYDSLMTNTRRQEPRFLAIWDQIATTFANAPANVYFEVLNEPTLDINMDQVNGLYAKTIPIIRRTNPARKIILGGNSWNSVEAMRDVNWPDDKNIVATFHDYGPHAFTHQGAEWSDPVMPLGRIWGSRSDMNELKETYQIANAFQKKTGLPILVGEFGVIDKVPQAQRNQWTKARRKAMEASGFSWCAWDMMGAFKSYDIQTEQWIAGVEDALISNR